MSTLVSWMLIPLLIRYASQLGMLDVPGERKVHTVAIPRCGGLGISIGAIVAVVLLLPVDTLYFSVMVGGLIIILFGIADDILEINYKWKFLGQFIAVGYVVSQGVFIKVVPFLGMNEAPTIIGYIFTVFFVVGVTNAVNLSDGLDGLAAGIMLLSLSCIAFFSYFLGDMQVGVMAVAIMGGIIGFLRFNTHPASIFMGDTGSQFIGFMTIFLAILLTQNVSVALNPALPLLILGVPILDTISVMVQRLRAGSSPFSPDKRHIHHKLLVYGFTHEDAVAGIYILQAWFLISAFYLKYASDWEVVGTYVLISSLVLTLFYFAGKKGWLLHRHIKYRRNKKLRHSNWLFPFCRKYIELAVIIYLALLLACILYYSTPPWYQEAALVIMSFGLFRWVSLSIQKNLIRICIYSSVLFGCHTILPLSDANQFSSALMNLFFILLLSVVILAIRITRKTYFKLTTQDVLVVFFALSALFIVETEYIIRTILYLFCLGYAVEYLFHREAYLFKSLRALALLAMLNFGAFLSGIY